MFTVGGRRIWWTAAFYFSFSFVIAWRIHTAGISFWLQKADLYYTLFAILLAGSGVGLLVWASTRRAVNLGVAPRFLLTNFFILPIPFWIYALGFVEQTGNTSPAPFKLYTQKVAKFSFGFAFVILVGLGLTFWFSAYSEDGSIDRSAASSAIERQLPSKSRCFENGVSYFKEIGSYPRLKTTGEYARDVAKDRCGRSVLAFGY